METLGMALVTYQENISCEKANNCNKDDDDDDDDDDDNDDTDIHLLQRLSAVTSLHGSR